MDGAGVLEGPVEPVEDRVLVELLFMKGLLGVEGGFVGVHVGVGRNWVVRVTLVQFSE